MVTNHAHPRGNKMASLLVRGVSGVAANGSRLFNHPLLDSPQGFQTLTSSTLSLCEGLVKRILSGSGRDLETLRLFDELSNAICQSADLSECIRLLHPDHSYASAAQTCCVALGGFVEQLNTNRDLYDTVKRINVETLGPVSAKHAASLLHDFEISGIHLSDSNRDKVVQLHQYILSLNHTFVEQCSAPSLVKTNSAPSSILRHRNLFSYHDDKETLYIDSVPYFSEDPVLRKDSYKEYYASSHPNKVILDELLLARDSLARLVGYETFAHRALADTMAGSPEVVMSFLDALNERMKPIAEEEMNEMANLIEKGGRGTVGNKSLPPWDVPLAIERAGKNLFKNSDNLSEYFPLSACLDGLRLLISSLFDVKMELVNTASGETWHESVEKYAFTRNGGVLGYLYCDWFNREGKLASDCQFTIQGGREGEDGTYQLPISTLSLSLPSHRPRLTHYAVQNLFHEMGHALHSILGRSPYQNTSGTRCSTDYAEIPSNLMEIFLQDNRVLGSFSRHYKTREFLPFHLLSSFQFSSSLFPAFKTQEQILYSVMDQVFHGPHPLDGSTTEIFSRLHEKYFVADHTPGTSWFLRFSHLHSYAGKYYSYLWSRSVANLIWKECFQNDPYSRSSGRRYEEAMLMHGGGLHPLKMVRGLLGYEPSIEELVDAYCDEVYRTRECIDEISK